MIEKTLIEHAIFVIHACFAMIKKIGHIRLLVYDISDAITFYTKKLGFSLSMKLRLILMDCILIVLGVILLVVRGYW